AGNAYLAGTGRLGEVTCDGTQAVGHFWSSALGWPLVWDQDEETAIQSPAGGTKIAWGGPPMAAKRGRNPQHFVLEVGAAEREREVARLTGLGARHTSPPSDGPAELTDPDGNEFVVRAR
ncbi:MAG TPA: VOC family protein, partial [Tetrasphaera sp.]|nr:VOC family protein [Tetrasphaera sp.]